MKTLLLVFVGCFVGCAIPEGRFACERNDQCPAGWFCSSGLCYSNEPVVGDDGGVSNDAEVGTCGLASQVGCGMGEKCSFEPWILEPSCGPDGTEPPFANCARLDGRDTCAAGSLCWQYFGGRFRCSPFCETDDDCVSFGRHSSCARLSTAGPQTFCTSSCDPITNRGCSPGETCQIQQYPGHDDLVFECLPVGPADRGAACVTHLDCGTGTGCVFYETDQVCRMLCGPTAPCTVGQTCALLRDGFGYCVPN